MPHFESEKDPLSCLDFDLSSIEADSDPSPSNSTPLPHFESENVPLSCLDFDLSSIYEESQIEAIEESCIQDKSINQSELSEIAPKFEIIPSGSKKKTDLLLDGLGFSYTVKCKFPLTTTWMCTRRSGSDPCRATVRQKNSNFTLMKQHIHQGNKEINDKVKVRLQVKEKATERKFSSARDIVEEVFVEYYNQHTRAYLPDLANTIRMANKTRSKLLPPNPSNINFQLKMEFIPSNFFRGEISKFDTEGNYRVRHLVFMSDHQIEKLANAKRWYVDGTFHIVNTNLFHQLFTIHAFLRKDENIKQVPLAFVLMSGRKSSDYEKVFKTILDILPYTRVKEIVSDFEKAMWKCVKKLNSNPLLKTFKNVKHFGCAFHFTQAIYRKIQELGLVTPYKRVHEVTQFCRRLMSIHLIHYKDVNFVFQVLKGKISRNPKYEIKLRSLCEYFEQNWLKNNLWEPKCWSVFNQPIRTNNDVEGWHLRMKKKAKNGNLPIYSLFSLLYKESELVPIQADLLSSNKLKRSQKERYKYIQYKLFKHWSEFESRRTSSFPLCSWELLKMLASVYSSSY